MISNKLIGYKQLIAWQKAHRLAFDIYKVTLQFPKNELYAMTSQLQRAALSVPLNIVEGYGRNSKKEFSRFLSISLGSLAETGYLLEFSHELKYVSDKDFDKLYQLKEEVGQIIWSLQKSLK